ncbi:unnamed protein product [Spirodela intermedia]|uniref:Uncharacterized protein n=1 Tax=Spirodela intermedia TaxID=51605 RepID=A0A7I8IID0_SPIIN|nr:unnamed protein product [Spirodela intermedia]CAA6656915.1 unnamed protein product [Spirodela intermedia]
MDAQLVVAGNRTRPVHQVVCYRRILVTSTGVWLGKKPLSHALPLLLTQVSLISAIAAITHSLLRRLGQSSVVSQIAAGAIVGFSGAASDRRVAAALFPPQSKIQFDVLSGVGVILFLFMVGVKTDMGMIAKSGRKAAAVGFSCTLVPFVLMSFFGLLLRQSMSVGFREELVYQLAATWARTSYAVLSCVLDVLNLLNSKVGRLAMSATLISEFNKVIATIETALRLGMKAKSQMMGIGAFFSFLALLGFILLVARPVTLWVVRRTPEGEQMKAGHLLAVLSMAFACGLINEVIGHQFATDAFLLGLALPGGPPLGATLDRKFDTMVSGILVPLFMAGARCGYVVFFVLLGGVGKVVGVLLPSMYCKVPLRDALTLALMMNTKGIFEVYIVDGQMYAVMVLCVVAFSVVTNFLVKITYKPSMDYLVNKRRTLQHSRMEAELRILACIHTQENVVPIVELLKTCLASYRKPKGSAGGAAETDHIMNAFSFLQQENKGSILVLPFVAISPQATMHDDVCALALEKKASFVILHFHKKMAIDGSMETVAALKNMNINTLNYAPCSVGILVDQGPSTADHLLYHIAVYFLDGADDREAVAFAIRAAENPTTGVTVVRYRLPREWREPCAEEDLDDEMVSEFRMSTIQNHRVTYREEVVKDGQGTIGVIRSSSSYFSLLVVGLRKGKKSPLTEGLSLWSEYPELGALGDVLASTDFGCTVSTLVVQQQTRVGVQQSEGAHRDKELSASLSLRKRSTPS